MRPFPVRIFISLLTLVRARAGVSEPAKALIDPDDFMLASEKYPTTINHHFDTPLAPLR
jgi:hypothetical protein